MGFYDSKINTYSKFVKIDDETLAFEKKKFLVEDAKEIDKQKEYLRIMRHASRGENLISEEENALNLKMLEYDFVKTLEPSDFFKFLGFVEHHALCKIEENALNERKEHSEKLNKYQEQKGFIGKASALFGTDKKKIEKNSKLVEGDDLTIGVANACKTEWNALSDEEKLVYLIGRFEMDGKTRFDQKAFDDFKALVNLENQKEENEPNLVQ